MEFGKIAFIVCLSIAASTAATIPGKSNNDDGTGKCPGGYTQGSQANIGRYWYECQDGKMAPKGCLDEDDRRVDAGSTFDTKTKEHRMQCVLGADGYLTVIYKACLRDGQERQVGSQWDDGKAFYICRKDGPNSLRTTMLGCIDQGRQVQFDDKVAKGDFLYQCKKNADGAPQMNVVGCVSLGRKLAIGETYQDDAMWYTCTNSGVKTVGCVHNGERMKDGDRFTRDDVEYRCAVDGDNTGLVPFSCLQHDAGGSVIERRVGCHWEEGQYEWTCRREPDNKTATKVPTRCNYKSAKGTLLLEPGCLSIVDTTAVGCKRTADGLQIVTGPADQADGMSGVRQC